MTADRRDDAEGRGAADSRGPTVGLSRRRLLAGLGGLGAVGMASGAGTAAYLSDRETFRDNTFVAGAVEIELSFDGSCRGCVASDDGRASFAFDDIDRGDSGRIVLSVAVQTNPARLWLGANDCPPATDPLGDAIEATLSVRDLSVTGSLSDLRREIVERGGLRLDDRDGDACLNPADGPIAVALDWDLPVETPDDVAGASTSFDVQFGAEQCRHVSEAAASNPFAGLDCLGVERRSCAVCADDNGTKIGSLTFRYRGAEPTAVTVVAQGGNDARSGREAFSSPAVAPGQSFTITAAVAGSRLARNLYLTDGASEARSDGPGRGKAPVDRDGVKVHTSCSERLEPGMVFGEFELVGGTTTTGDPLCNPVSVPDDRDAEDDASDAEENGEAGGRNETGTPDQNGGRGTAPDRGHNRSETAAEKRSNSGSRPPEADGDDL